MSDTEHAEPEAVERRLHPVTPFRRAWVPLAALIGGGFKEVERIEEWVRDLQVGWLAGAVLALVAVFGTYGFLSWRFTWYVVTGGELRIRTGLLFRRTAHIRLDRLQAVDVTRPLLGRLVGVAALRMDVIGTEEKDELAFLGEADAVALRAELLARAAGFTAERAATVGEAPGRELLRVSPREVVLSIVLNLGVWTAVPAALAGAAFVWWFTGSAWATFGIAFPFLASLWKGTLGRLLAEWDWTVAESPDGLRVDHGLLDKEHETVPPGRVQAIRLVEPFLWRRRGLVRVELDVAGSKNDVLVPVAPWPRARVAIARILPGVDVDALEFAPAPRSARWVNPLWWRGQGLAVTDEVFASRRGLVCRRTAVVPHAKAQSVRLTRGPWQRVHGVADVTVDTGANTSVTAALRELGSARELTWAQADRARLSRARAAPDRWMTGGPAAAPAPAGDGSGEGAGESVR
ncbi:PH domain-containing protein [Streptomyces sp. BI20]|uniref:PH domain-containing protein n=1 Tax=Streptomyces sp. BI20 TaxID=3403460 RepID=UPI003C708CFC